MDPEAAVRALDRTLTLGEPQVAIMSVDWSRYVGRFQRPPAFLASLAAEASPRPLGSVAGPAITLDLTDVPVERRAGAVAEHVRRQVLAVLGAPTGLPLRHDQGLRDVGLDSLMALELKARLEQSVGQPLPPTLVFDYPTIAAITDFLAREVLALAGADGPAEPVPAERAPASDLDQLSEEEAELLLQEELALIARAREDGAGV
jgi:hypothetical protein